MKCIPPSLNKAENMPILHKLIKNISEKTWAERVYLLMYFGFCFYILFFPLGRAFREIGMGLCTFGLIFYYFLDYKHSNLAKFPLKWLFFVFWAYIFFKVFHSMSTEKGWYLFQHGTRKGILFFFVGVECVHGMRDIKRFILLFCIMSFYEGLDGIYQYITRYDLFRNLPTWGSRLTGSFLTPRVGGLMALVLPPVMGIFFLWKSLWSKRVRYFFTLILMSPGLFLLVGAQSRSAYIGFLFACFSLIFFFRGTKWLKISIPLILILSTFLILQSPHRVSYENAITDPRIAHIWPAAVKIFTHAPILGVGIGGFGGAVANNLGLSMPDVWTTHPHNIYLQFACETGLVGLSLFLAWISSYLWWSWKKIRSGWNNASNPAYWGMAFCFWTSYIAYLGTSLSARDFFRPWWLGLSLAILGILIGACIAPSSEEKKDAK